MTGQKRRFPIGISDFRKLREGAYHYVDKTKLIDAVLSEGAEVMLLPRPRRFGKTLNLSMLRCFLEKSPEDASPLFADLAVASSEIARPHFQRYPVIFLTFEDVRPASWEACERGIAKVLAEEYGRHAYLLTDGRLSAADAVLFTAIRERRATSTDLVFALQMLSRLLAEHHGERVVILLDEHDSPIHAGHANGYYEEVTAFFSDFLSGGLKDSPHLLKGVLTGILRVAKESVFSGLNNVAVHGILRSEFAPYFGFTEPEVQRLVDEIGRPDVLGDIRAFYNGYRFGREAIYNPWSVLAYLGNADKELLPYWVDAGSNDLVRELLTGPGRVRAELEVLLAGGTVDKRIDENIALRDIAPGSGAVWSLLLLTGYLKPIELRMIEGERWAKLGVPNAEVAIALRRMVRTWIETQQGDVPVG